MLINYLIVALRNLKRQPLYSVLTIAGLAIGLASCLLITLFIRDELSYDQFHAKKDRIFRVITGLSDDGKPTNANGQIAAGPALAREFGEVERYVRFRKFGWNEKRAVSYGQRRFYEKRFMLADSTLFEIFSFRLLEGDPHRALIVPHSIVVTKSIAAKYFGHEEAMGRKLSIDENNDGMFVDFTVTGVIEDLPRNSSIRFDMVASLSGQTDNFRPWSLETVFTFVLLRPGTDVPALTAKFHSFLEHHLGRKTRMSLHLQPLNDVRLYSNLNGQMEPPGDASYVYITSAVAVFILLIACINFVNLSTARSIRRAREVGVRKVFGAQRPQLIRQFIGESVVVTALSVGLSLVFADGMLPAFNHVADKNLTLLELASPEGIGLLFLLTLVVGLLAGSYPAYVLSSFLPASVLHSSSSKGKIGASAIRKGLVVVQFTISMTMMACTGIVYAQMNLVRTMNLGFQREQMVVLPLNDAIRARVESFKKELRANHRILGVTLSEQVPGRAGNGVGYRVDGSESKRAYRMLVDTDFLKTYGVDLLAGRDFSGERPADKDDAFIINESLSRACGFRSPQEAIGKRITMIHAGTEKPGSIIGVSRDFHIQSLHDKIEETLLAVMPPSKFNFVSIRMAPGDLEGTLSHIQKTWAGTSPDYPFDYYFLDEDFDQLHRTDERLGEVFGYFALLAIIAACLGLFGLASFAAAQRTREIGIRKVLGASVPGLVELLTREFLVLVGISVLLSWPLAYFGMDRWLQNFAYHVPLSPAPFLAAGVSGLLIAFATVAYQGLRAANANPVESLRHE